MDEKAQEKRTEGQAKPVYVSPTVMRLDDIHAGTGRCQSGSGEAGSCLASGNSASGRCWSSGSGASGGGRCTYYGSGL